MGGPEKGLLFRYGGSLLEHSLLWAGVLGDGLGSLRDGVLSQLSGEEEPHRGLDLPRGDGGPLVIVSQTGSLSGDPGEDVVDKGVHDAHGLGGDTGVGVHLLQYFVNVDGIRLPPPPPAFLIRRVCGLCLSGGFLRAFASCGNLVLGWHDCDRMRCTVRT